MGSKIRLGIIGGGGDSLIGVLHRVASSMFDRYELVGGVFNPDWEENIGFAERIGLKTDRVYKDFETLISEEVKLPKAERMEVISVLTPNFLHYPMAKKLLENGFHVICEKPLTTTYEEALDLKKTKDLSNNIFAVTYTYSGYPMIRQMRKMIEEGVLGEIQKVDVQYFQGWINPIIHDADKRAATWRLQPDKSGISCCIGDIGTHAFDMIEFVTGLKVKKVLSDLNYVYQDNQMDVDGTVLIRFSENVKGVIRASQIATGEENSFIVKIYGQKAGLKWNQENPNYVEFLQEGKALKVLKPGHAYNSALSLDGTKLPPGHPEGIFDAMGNIYKGVARAIKGEPYDEAEYPSLEDGMRGMNFIEQTVASHIDGNVWKELD
ncbi:Gfo/Idh/MocA family oxidoreductase [Lutimonas saemankumensis]|uniref:Gfo/Idh/MocA family protein n=1 Tax=Lutimonas saemankumensis TaxID=483016 RepID=UPI001CD746D4|nr:Gfo/Idh/MocA family oxidoreductase [Lutimonas saemankumensis]MCA0931214.1 Gfo/Idh/MocA family oxidoreductase [Lutimonas saemankumensis]